MEWIESLLEKYGRLKLAQEAKDLDDARNVLATDREVVRAHHRRTLGESFRQKGDDDSMIHIGDRHDHVHVEETHANGRRGLLAGPLGKLAVAAGLIASGALKPQVAATFPLEEAAKAMELMESREFFGKIVLTAGGDA